MNDKKKLLDEMADVKLAIELFELGARLQIVEAETDISRPRLIRLYKEVRGASPPKGLLPFSSDWFITWMPNIHASLFYNMFKRMEENCRALNRMELIIKTYKLYLEVVGFEGEGDFRLGLTRAWTLVRFFDCNLLDLTSCTRCKGNYVTYPNTPCKHYLCGICQPPSRAGKKKKSRDLNNKDSSDFLNGGVGENG